MKSQPDDLSENMSMLLRSINDTLRIPAPAAVWKRVLTFFRSHR